MPKLVNYEEMRKEISKTALDVFFKKGYHQTNLIDVAKEHGVGRTTLYQYFKNKEELYAFSVRNWSAQMLDRLETGVKNESDGKGQVLYIIKEMLSLKYYGSMVVLTLEQFPTIKEKNSDLMNDLDNIMDQIRGMIQNALVKASEDGYHLKMSASSMASMVYALIEGFIVETTLTTKRNIDECLKTSKELLDGLM